MFGRFWNTTVMSSEDDDVFTKAVTTTTMLPWEYFKESNDLDDLSKSADSKGTQLESERPSGCGIIRWWYARQTRRASVKFFKELDEDVLENLKDSSIKLLRADFLRSGVLSRIKRRQDLELDEKQGGVKIFLTPKAAAKAFSKSRRSVGVLTYGWNCPGDPDPSGVYYYLAAVCAFLQSALLTPAFTVH